MYIFVTLRVYLNVSMVHEKTGRVDSPICAATELTLRQRKRVSEAGFGVPEIIITIVVLGVMSIGIIGIFRSILYIQTATNYQKIATFAAQREIETLRNSNYNQLVAGSTINFTSELPPELPRGKTGTVIVSEPVAGIKQVDVTVAYKHNNSNRQVKVSSMIGVIGITK